MKTAIIVAQPWQVLCRKIWPAEIKKITKEDIDIRLADLYSW